MVAYEAARAICALPLDARDISPAVNVLQKFLSSNSSILRFAAVRTLSQVSLVQPMLVTKCNEDMELLITDSNRSIATLSITTLLKTGAESSVDRLMTQISNFMNDISEDFKIVVVRGWIWFSDGNGHIYEYMLTYVNHYANMLTYLNMLIYEHVNH